LTHWGSLQRLPRPLAEFRSLLLKEGEGRKREVREGQGKGRGGGEGEEAERRGG